VLLSSWRDLCGRGEPPTPLTALGVVTRDDLARLDPPRSRGAHVAVCGSLHDAAVRHAPAMSRADFCGRLSLDPDRPIVLYATAANDGEEAGRVTWLAERLQGMEGRPQLLIRSNPMDVSDGGYAAIAAREGVALLEPRWEWAREREWNCPLPADLPWWRGALEHAALAVTLPSTVALDLAAWGKPTLHVAWGRGAALWAGESYAAVRSVEGVVAASDPEEAVARIGGLLQAPPKLVAPERDPLEAALRLLRRAFQVGARHVEPGHGMSSPYNSTSQDAVGQKAATP
jgi:hypothetical protein